MNFIFDVDDTLYDLTQPFRQAVTILWGKQIAIDVDRLFALSRQYSDQIFPKIMSEEISLDEAGIYRIRAAMKDMGHPIDRAEAKRFQQCYRQNQYEISLSEVMGSLLDDLKAKNQTLGILTNGLASHQQRKIDSLRMERWVKREHIFISETIQASKPERQAFDHVERAMKLNKAETYYIGDSPEHDVKGAINAGWHMIFFNRRHRDIHTLNEQPDDIVTSETELAAVIKRMLVQE